MTNSFVSNVGLLRYMYLNPRRVFFRERIIDNRNKYHREKCDIDKNQSTEWTDGHQEIKCLWKSNYGTENAYT